MICDQAYVLDVKAFQEAHARVQLFSDTFGRYTAIFKNVYSQSKKSQQLRSYLQTANIIELSYPSSSVSMPVVFNADLIKNAPVLSSKNYLLLSYINELLLKLLPERIAIDAIFNSYTQVLPNIVQGCDIEQNLRLFEWSFLQELDAQTDWYYCVETGDEILKEKLYQFSLGSGFSSKLNSYNEGIPGSAIIDIGQGDFKDSLTNQYAKKIFRILIKQLLGQQTLKSREAYLALYT